MLRARFIGLAAPVDDLEDRRGLGRGPTRDPIEPALLVGAELARTLGDVEDDGRSRPVELVLEVRATRRHLLDDRVADIEDLQRALVHVETFMVEGHAAPSASSRRSCGSRIDTASTV